MENKKVILGMYEDKLNEMVPCALYEPTGHSKEDQIYRIVYDLYLQAGEPLEGQERKCSSYSFKSGGFGSTAYGFSYDCELSERLKETDWQPWQVPRWAIALAGNIVGTINKAEQVGHENGYNSGLDSGKHFVARLARGELNVTDFETVDGRDDRRLNRKQW